MRSIASIVVLTALALPSSALAQQTYAGRVLATPGVAGYWRLGETGGAVAQDATGRSAGSYLGGPALGARGGLSFDADSSVRFDGADDDLQVGDSALTAPGTIEGWFFWEAGVALMRDSTASAGWILAFDSGGRVAYRVGGTMSTTALATADLRDGWHHIALTVASGGTSLYVDGVPVHSGAAAGPAAAVMPWHVMRNGTTNAQYTRGRADEIALYATALPAATIKEHFETGRDTSDTTAPAAPSGLQATAKLNRVELDWSNSAESDLDGYDVYRATSPSGPFARVNASRLSASQYSDTAVTGGTQYVYAVTASDVANRRSAHSSPVTATPPSTADLLRAYSPHLRYETQETYFADSAAEMTDSYVSGSRTNYLVNGSGTRLAAADPANPLPNLSLAFLGDPVYGDGRTAATSDYLDAANASYQQDAQRMRAAGYGDRVYGRAFTAAGKTWLQYWLFSYYNPQNVLGFGVHEGDWEFVQVGLDANGAPDVATYAQHGGGERCAWSQVQRTAAGAPIVYVALASHASYFSAGIHPRGLLPDDNHRGTGYQVRPSLEIVSQSTPFMAWRGKWGASSSSPIAPRRQVKWGDPNGFHAGAAGCSVGTTQRTATARARRAAQAAPASRRRARRREHGSATGSRRADRPRCW